MPTAITPVPGRPIYALLGDNALSNRDRAQYQTGVFDMYPVMLRQSVLWPTRGNHDHIHAGPDNDYYDLFHVADRGGRAAWRRARGLLFLRLRQHPFHLLDSEARAVASAERWPSGAEQSGRDAGATG